MHFGERSAAAGAFVEFFEGFGERYEVFCHDLLRLSFSAREDDPPCFRVVLFCFDAVFEDFGAVHEGFSCLPCEHADFESRVVVQPSPLVWHQVEQGLCFVHGGSNAESEDLHGFVHGLLVDGSLFLCAMQFLCLLLFDVVLDGVVHGEVVFRGFGQGSHDA